MPADTLTVPGTAQSRAGAPPVRSRGFGIMLVPAALGALSVLITFALVYLVASHTEVSVYATTMVTMIGIGVAVDYSMFILARFREELLAGAATDRAVATAMATSGTAVAFSGMTVIVSLASIWIVPVRAVQSMALAAIMVVTVAVLAAMTLLFTFVALRRLRFGDAKVTGRCLYRDFPRVVLTRTGASGSA